MMPVAPARLAVGVRARIVLSAAVGALIGGALMAFTPRGRDSAIPFGPFLAAAGWIALLYGDSLTALYLETVGLR